MTKAISAIGVFTVAVSLGGCASDRSSPSEPSPEYVPLTSPRSVASLPIYRPPVESGDSGSYDDYYEPDPYVSYDYDVPDPYDSYVPRGGDIDCAEVGHEVYIDDDDPNGLDADGNGVGCEDW